MEMAGLRFCKGEMPNMEDEAIQAIEKGTVVVEDFSDTDRRLSIVGRCLIFLCHNLETSI